jgi:hypothetical protein
LKKQLDLRVRGYAVWVPMRGGAEKDVAEATATLPDVRVLHFWDDHGFTLRTFALVLGLPAGREAWDVYLIYGPTARWDETNPPAPDYWMHQLQGVTNGPFLNADLLADHLAQTLHAAR